MLAAPRVGTPPSRLKTGCLIDPHSFVTGGAGVTYLEKDLAGIQGAMIMVSAVSFKPVTAELGLGFSFFFFFFICSLKANPSNSKTLRTGLACVILPDASI